jgi:Cytochrome c oxidase assembly protein CtaG/Cox11
VIPPFSTLALLALFLLQIFFYVDPAFLKDPQMENVKSLTLSYTFFRTGEAEVLDIANEYQKREASIAAAKAQLQKIKEGQKQQEQEADKVAVVPTTDAPATRTNVAGGAATKSEHSQEAIKAWTEAISAKTGIKINNNNKEGEAATAAPATK